MGDKETKPLAGLRILVVDDSADILRFLEMALNLSGAECTGIPDPLRALEEAPRGDYHLAFIDVMMPGMNGHDLIRKLRERGWSTPAVALTGLREPDQAERAQAAGFTDYLPKPMELDQLVAKALEHARRKEG